jgi:hypothetical protein
MILLLILVYPATTEITLHQTVGDNVIQLQNEVNENGSQEEWSNTDLGEIGDKSDKSLTDITEWTDSDLDVFGDNSDAFLLDANKSNVSNGDNTEKAKTISSVISLSLLLAIPLLTIVLIINQFKSRKKETNFNSFSLAKLGIIILIISLFLPFIDLWIIRISGWEMILMLFESIQPAEIGQNIDPSWDIDDDYNYAQGVDLPTIFGQAAGVHFFLSPIYYLTIYIVAVIAESNGKGTRLIAVAYLCYFLMTILMVLLSGGNEFGVIGEGYFIASLSGLFLFNRQYAKALYIDEEEWDEDEYDEVEEEFIQFQSLNSILPSLDSSSEQEESEPPFNYQGEINEEGWEICEFPNGSQNFWWKDYENQCWVEWN